MLPFLRNDKLFLAGAISLFYFVPFTAFAVLDSKNPQEIENLKKQIQQILQINEKVKAKNEAQVQEVKRIIEQARIDQQILAKIETQDASKAFKKDMTNELLRQEKIRLIQEQSLRNINALQNINPLPAVSKPMPEESARK